MMNAILIYIFLFVSIVRMYKYTNANTRFQLPVAENPLKNVCRFYVQMLIKHADQHLRKFIQFSVWFFFWFVVLIEVIFHECVILHVPNAMFMMVCFLRACIFLLSSCHVRFFFSIFGRQKIFMSKFALFLS